MAATLRVMTFNLRRDAESDGDHRWANRRDAVAALVREHAPHLLGTQEGLPHMLRDLDERLPGYERVGGCRRGDGSDEACAVFYDATRLALVAWGDLWLSDTPGEPGSRSWGNRLPRIVTWATFRDLATGQELSCANTHLDHESEEARVRAARLLAQRVPGALLMGDFNAAPGDEVHRTLLEAGWVDAHDAHEVESGPVGTFHGFTGVTRGRIDWVLAPARHVVRSHRVPVAQGPRWASDHHPVVVEVAPAR